MTPDRPSVPRRALARGPRFAAPVAPRAAAAPLAAREAGARAGVPA